MAVSAMLAGCDAQSTPPGQSTAESSDSAGQEQAIEFVSGYAQGYQHAQTAGKPMLVFFTARWCDYCHQMRREAFTDRRVIDLSRQFVCVLVDADEEPGVCQEFAVRGYPTVQFLSPRGVPLNRLTGKTSSEGLSRQMQAALQAIASRTNLQQTTRR